jgi:hypothetical protein|mmetsp:Transcript_108254/g.170677  ORF Transcript_108254/g.170677 Transcript_108254/m.170677 type:complete len:445 (-) Transcript_108254:60-1394(-)
MGERQHFLDWLRAILIGCVVYAHLNFCGLVSIPDEAVDNHAFRFENPSGEKLHSLLAVRYNSILRQWCIPLLFWISGASAALSYSGLRKFLKNITKIGVFTWMGVAINGTMWLLGPRDPLCSISSPCKDKGVLFDFTEDPFNGNVEPFFNQMWFTLALILVMLVNRGFCNVVCGGDSLLWLIMPLCLAALIYIPLFIASELRVLSALWLIASEVLFLFVSGCTYKAAKLPECHHMPARGLQYLSATISVLQCGIFQIVPPINDITAGYVLFLAICCNRWFQLGVLMTKIGDAPLLSQAWPVVIILVVLFAPSTNWIMAGVLTYPYYSDDASGASHLVDRCLYFAGTFTMFFVVHRISLSIKCVALPNVIGKSALVLYICQIAFITICLQVGMRSVVLIWFACCVAAIVLTSGLMLIQKKARRDRNDGTFEHDQQMSSSLWVRGP